MFSPNPIRILVFHILFLNCHCSKKPTSLQFLDKLPLNKFYNTATMESTMWYFSFPFFCERAPSLSGYRCFLTSQLKGSSYDVSD